MPAILAGFKAIQPKNQLDQDTISLWLSKIHSIATPETFDERVLKRFAVKKESIASRSFFNADFGKMEFDVSKLFNQKNNFTPSHKERSLFYKNTTDELLEQFFKEEQEAPGEIIHVSCTGYVSPSAGQKIIPKMNWSDTTGLTHVYHMGCYAAMPAIKIARGLSEKKRIDIVHTEICSLHFDVLAQTPEQTVVHTLFSDGAIKYSLYPDAPENFEGGGISIFKLKEKIIPDSEEAMTWGIGDNSFQMTLHRTVPALIKENLLKFSKDLFEESGFNFEQEKDHTLFAIHPGGPKIIEQIMDLLKLDENKIRHSKEVLRERGNMSSATLPHVWEKIIQDSEIKAGTKIFSVAFGPGLTIAGFLGAKV
jgi:predicted naringenin-chalcone synthase